MRVLHVHDFIAPGNSRFGIDMDRLLAARGHEVHLLAAVGGRGPADGASIDGVRYHTYPHPSGGLLSRYRAARRHNAERFRGLGRFDVLVLNQPLCANAILDLPEAEGVPRVYWFISPWAAEWKAEHPGAFAGWLQAGLRRRQEAKALARCDAVLVESEFIRGRLRAEHPWLPEGKVTLVPGAVDLTRFTPEGPKADLGPGPVVLTVRRHVERMGIDLLIRAAALCGVSLVIGGEGPRRAELEDLARSLGVRAKFVGFVPDEELPGFYRGADLFVLPTRELEGFGLVAIEAMACGTPAMGTPVGAIPEVLGPLGLLFDAATPEAIAAGLRRFFAERDPALPKRCRDHVAARYDWAKVIGGVDAVLHEVTRARAGHGRG